MRTRLFLSLGLALLGTATVAAEPDAIGSAAVVQFVDVPPPSPVHQASPLPAGCDECSHSPRRGGYRHHGPAMGRAVVIPYRRPLLPPPASFYGYFNSPPEHAHVWDNYPLDCHPHRTLHAAPSPRW